MSKREGVFLADREFISVCPEASVDFEPILNPCDPRDYFLPSEKLWIDWDVHSLIIKAAGEPKPTRVISVSAFLLLKNAYDREISVDLPASHFEAGEFCQIAATMLDAQPRGLRGSLFTDGNPNIFYVRGVHEVVFALRIYWGWSRNKWFVLLRRLNESGKTEKGAHIFCRTYP